MFKSFLQFFGTFCCCLMVTMLCGQDIGQSPVEAPLCKPGIEGKSRGKGLVVEFGSKFRPQGVASFASTGGSRTQRESFGLANLKLKLPLYYKPHLIVLLGLKHQTVAHPVRYNSDFEDLTLKSSGFSLNIVKPLDKKHYAAIKLEATHNGPSGQWLRWSSNARIIKGAAFFGVKRHKDFEWGIGAGFSHGLARTAFYPFMVYNRNFSPKFGIEALLPAKIYGRYNFNDGALLMLGASFSSSAYLLEERDASLPHYQNRLSRQEIAYQVILEKQVSGWLWMTAKAGYVQNMRNNVQGVQASDQLFVETEAVSGPFARIGIFLSPPSKSCKK